DNALVHGAGATKISHSVADDAVTITVSDEGAGLRPRTHATRSEPDGADRINGLGLPLARRLIATMPGRLSVVHAGRHPRIDITVQLAIRPAPLEPSPL